MEPRFQETLANTIETEKTLISGLWLKEGKVIPDVAEILSENDFYRPEHRIIYAATLKVYEENGSFDFICLLDKLQSIGQLERVGRKYVTSLLDYEFTTSRVVQHAKIIHEKAQKRALCEFGQELIYNASEDTMTVEELMSFSDTKLQSIQGREVETQELLSEIASERFGEILSQRANQQNMAGLTTGLYSLNKATGGLKKSDLIILAARPGMGKTALALNIAVSAAKKVPTLMFSLEMSKKQLVDRAISSASHVDLSRIQNSAGYLTDGDITAMTDAVEQFDKLQLTIDDTGGLKLSEIRMRARRFKRKSELGLIVIDYLQLIEGDKEKENRVQEVSAISRGLKALAKELDIPILALSQLSRNVELRADKRPQLSDLRDSGSIEQDADIVMFLYRDEYYSRGETENQNIAELIIAKNRNGATGSTRLYFEPEYQFFGDLTRADRRD